jgi:hypothetical protein
MANHQAINFYIYIEGDGASTTLVVTAATAAFGFLTPGNGTTPVLDLATLVPTGFLNLSCSNGVTVTATILLGIITFTLSGPIANGTIEYITGYLTF